MRRSGSSGFTIMELLIVIAIVGIIVAIIAALVTNARAKGFDAKTKSGLVEVRVMAAEKTTGSGSGDFVAAFNDPQITSALSDMATKLGISTTPGVDYDLQVTPTEYAIVFPLKADSGYWCVDSIGNSKRVGGFVNTSGVKSCTNTPGAVGNNSPSITLTGANPVSCMNPINLWVEPSYTASDTEDGNLTSSVTYSDLHNVPSISYETRRYSVTDSGGATTTADRVFNGVCGGGGGGR